MTTTRGRMARRRSWRATRLAWLGLLPATGLLLATAAAAPASAAQLTHRAVPAQQPGHRAAASPPRTLAQAPAGLRAAVRAALGQPGTARGGSAAPAAGAIAQTKLLPRDAQAQNTFGVSIAISGNTALIGATTANGGPGAGTGAAYVFIKGPTGRWAQQAKLRAADGIAMDNFGFSVALDGNTALVGAPNRGEDGVREIHGNGAAYVFVRTGTTWSQQALLTVSPAQSSTSDFFGFSAGLSGNTALVGAAGVNANTGAVFEFARSGTAWAQRDILTGSDSQPGDGFGWDVALSGHTALIGAPRNSPVFPGAAYVFAETATGFSQQAELAPPDSQNGDLFGKSVALSGRTALIGAPGCCAFNPKEGAFRGAAYIFVRHDGQWTNQAKLTARDGKPFVLNTNQQGDTFGESVALTGGTAVIGAPTKAKHPATVGAPIDFTGAAYEFKRTWSGRWSQKQKLTAVDGARLDRLGFAVGIAGGTGLAGAPFHHANRGAVYQFGL